MGRYINLDECYDARAGTFDFYVITDTEGNIDAIYADKDDADHNVEDQVSGSGEPAQVRRLTLKAVSSEILSTTYPRD